MYDSINLKLMQYEAGNVDIFNTVPCYLDNVGEHFYNEFPVITGNIGRLKISINRYQMEIKGGSLCKWYLGDNYQTMGRGDTQRAMEKLSDILHVPIGKARVTRLDIAQNIITQYPVDVYLNHLGALKYYKRLPMIEAGSLYYIQEGRKLCFYDKNKEQKSQKEPIPELYKGRNVLRFEYRLISKINNQLGQEKVTGEMLYNESFYVGLLNRWRDAYKSIDKINDSFLNFQEMRTKQDLYRLGVLSLVERAGGQLEMIRQINEAQKQGILSKKQAYDLRKKVKEACSIGGNFTAPNEAIIELDRKINDAIKFYR